VLRMVMRRGLWLTAVGLFIGIGLVLALGRVMAGLLYGVPPGDPVTLVGVSACLVVVAMLATYVPARRAARVEPSVALRAD
jgi:putative ABC transport system permease protein